MIDGVQGDELMLQRGVTYTFQVNTPGHPVYFTTNAIGGAGNPDRITTGVTNDLITNGTMIFTPDNSLQNQFFYQCGLHDTIFDRGDGVCIMHLLQIASGMIQAD